MIGKILTVVAPPAGMTASVKARVPAEEKTVSYSELLRKSIEREHKRVANKRVPDWGRRLSNAWQRGAPGLSRVPVGKDGAFFYDVIGRLKDKLPNLHK